MKDFFSDINPLLIVSILIFVFILIYSLIVYIWRMKILSKAAKDENTTDQKLKIIGESTPGGKVFTTVLKNTPSLLAFSLLIIIAVLALDKTATIPPILEKGFLLALGYFFGSHSKKTNADNEET